MTTKKTIFMLVAITLLISLISLVNATDFAVDSTPSGGNGVNVGDVPVSDSGASTTSKEYYGKITDEKDIGPDIGLEKGIIKVKGVEVKKPQGGSATLLFSGKDSYVEIKDSKGNLRKFTSLDKLKVKVEENGKWIDKEFDAKMIINNKGEIEEAYFTSTEGGKYAFDNSEVDVPKGAGVIYQRNKGKGELQLSVPANTKVTPPKVFDDKSTQKLSKVSYSTWDKSPLELENGMKINGAIVHYIDGKLAFSGKEVSIDSFIARDASPSKISYLDFTGKKLDVPGAYISMNTGEKTIFIGTNTNEDSHSVMFQKGNPYGLNFDADSDHMAVKVLGDTKIKSYFSITDKDRTDKGLVALGKAVGNIAINVDDGGFGTYLKDNEIYKSEVGRVFSDFNDIKGKTTVPAEFTFYKTNEKGEEVPVSIRNVIANGKPGTMEERIVLSNRNELGIGPDPTWISGSVYSQRYPVLTKGVSNRVSYNYVQFTPEGIYKFTGVKVSPDSYSKSRLKEEDYRMLLDWLNNLDPYAKKRIGVIYLHQRATMGGFEALAWGGPGGIEMGVGSGGFTPGILTHETTHAVNIGNSGFWSVWGSVGGSGDTEAPSEFAEYAFKDITSNLQTSKSFRGKMAVLVKQRVISQYVFDQQLLRAGLETGPQATDKYIREAGGG